MTEKQNLYLIYLLKTIGFDNNARILKYLSFLTSTFSRPDTYPSGRKFINYDHCFGILQKEIEIKRYEVIELKKINNTINATDFSAFLYCPVSLSINKSINIQYVTNQVEIEIGTNYHEKLRVAKRTYSNKVDVKDLSSLELKNRIILSKIKKASLLYSGHLENKPFFNSEENFVGDPDYVFVDEDNNKFIVEEKFSYKRDPQKLSSDEWFFLNHNTNDIDEEAQKRRFDWKNKPQYFHQNHIIQLYSYLRNYPEAISYGYLIYWFYDFDDSDVYIHKYDILKVIKSESNELIYQKVKTDIHNLRNSEKVKFDQETLNYKKCVKCSVNKYCGHKSGKYSDLTLPYNKDYLRLFVTDFPTELIKLKKNNSDNTTT